MCSDIDDECEAAAKCLRTLTQGSSEGMNPNWKPAYDNGLVPAVVKVGDSTDGKHCRIKGLIYLLFQTCAIRPSCYSMMT